MKKRLKDVNPLINPIGACGDYRLLNKSPKLPSAKVLLTALGVMMTLIWQA
jgi:hypothetical protein